MPGTGGVTGGTVGSLEGVSTVVVGTTESVGATGVDKSDDPDTCGSSN
jgi:hypothetical protein